MQWHEEMPEGVLARRPPLAHRLRGDKLYVTAWNDKVFSELRHGGGR